MKKMEDLSSGGGVFQGSGPTNAAVLDITHTLLNLRAL